MANKKVVKVNVYDEQTRKIVFTDAFLDALGRDGISIHDDKLNMETSDTIYVVDLKIFAINWNPSFEKIYGEDFPEGFKIENITPGMIRSLYEWTNPIFDQLPVKIKSKEIFLNYLREKMETDSNYYTTITLSAFKQLEKVDMDKRKSYFERFIPLGILTEADKIPYGYYADYTPEQLEQLFKEKEFTKREKIEIVSQAFAVESGKQEYAKAKGKKTNNSKRIKLINLLPPDEILDTFINGVLSEEEFLKAKVTKKDILELPYEMLLEVLSDKNDILPRELKIISRDLVNQYGRTLNGTAIYNLARYGYIEPDDFIEVYEINKALKMTDYEESMFEDEELSAYYTPGILLDMKENGKLSPKFLQSYLELEDFENHPELFKSKSKMLVGELERRLRENPDRSLENEVLELLNVGLCDVGVAKEKVSEEFIEKKFFEDGLTIDQVFEYYQKGLIGEEAILKYYSREELFELYEKGQIGGAFLRTVKDVDFLLQEFCDGKVSDSDFLRLYLESGNLSVIDLDEGLQLAEKEIDIASFITEATPYLKIKELFTHYLIDYASVLRLHNQGVINDEQLQDLKSALNTKEFFEELKSGKTYKVVTDRENETSPRRPVIPGIAVERDYSDEIALISALLGKEIEQEPYSLIESYNVKGRATSLNNYRIFGNEELDGIVVFQKSKKENAVYVMSALQMMYFLKGKENEESQIEIQNRMKDKAYLKTIEGVEVVEHTEYFARNLVEAASRISPKIAERVKAEDGRYVQDVDRMVLDMRQKYLEAKAKGRDDE